MSHSMKAYIAKAAQTVTSIIPSLPKAADIGPDLETARRVAERGFFKPGEDERLCELFSQYLRCRAALWEQLDELRRLQPHKPVAAAGTVVDRDQLKLFTIGFTAACALYRTANFLVANFRELTPVWKRLNHAEPRYGIPRKQFTAMYRSVSSLRNSIAFRDAQWFFRQHQAEIESLRDDPVMVPVLDLLGSECAFFDVAPPVLSPPAQFVQRLVYRVHSLRRRRRSAVQKVMFGLFERSGRVIAELQLPHAKRVTAEVLTELKPLLQAGDVIVTRHDNALSNLFLPGFWPHGALYIGTEAQRRELGLPAIDGNRHPICILEAKKDGVLFREIEETLSVDHFVVIRPQLSVADLRRALERAMTHANKLYDFEFDFSRPDRLVCTEVVYRAYDGIGTIDFEPQVRAGRVCVSAEDLLDHAVEARGFEPVFLYTDGGDGIRALFVGADGRVRERLVETYKKPVVSS